MPDILVRETPHRCNKPRTYGYEIGDMWQCDDETCGMIWKLDSGEYYSGNVWKGISYRKALRILKKEKRKRTPKGNPRLEKLSARNDE